MADTDDHWWWRNRRLLIGSIVDDLGPAGVVLDMGCGTAATVSALVERGHRAIGTDLSFDLMSRAPRPRLVVQARAEALPVPTRRVGGALALDVIEHLDHPIVALRELARSISHGGFLVVTVPAYPSMYGDYDVRAGHRRRYTSAALRHDLAAAGFEVERLTYFNAALVAPAFLARRTPLRRLGKGSDEDKSAGRLVSRLFGSIASIERRAIRRWSLPFGLSLLAVARPTHAGADTDSEQGDG